MDDWFARSCIEEAAFQEELDLLRETYPHIDEVHRSLTTKLASNPRLGDRLKYSDEYWLYLTDAIEATPSFWVLYRYDAQYVYLASIKAADED